LQILRVPGQRGFTFLFCSMEINRLWLFRPNPEKPKWFLFYPSIHYNSGISLKGKWYL